MRSVNRMFVLPGELSSELVYMDVLSISASGGWPLLGWPGLSSHTSTFVNMLEVKFGSEISTSDFNAIY